MADVTNYTIENASGANVRTDLNNVFAAIQSSNSKSSDLITSQCVAGMHFLNSSTNILKIRNSSNNAFTEIGNIDQPNLGLLSKSGGTMNGVLKLDDSNSATTPALSFDGDEDLGLFRKSANTMGFSSSGTERIFFDSNGINLPDENEVRFLEASSNGSNFVAIKAPASVTQNRTITLPDESGTILTSSSTISSSQLTGSGAGTITIGTTAINLGAAATTIAGLSEINVTSIKLDSIFNAGSANQSTADQIYEGRAKAWVNFDGRNTTIRDDFGVTSIGDHGQGIYQVNFSTSFSSTNYCPVGFVHRNNSSGGKVLCHIDTLNIIGTARYRFMVSGTSNAADVALGAVDVQYVFLSFFGDQ